MVDMDPVDSPNLKGIYMPLKGQLTQFIQNLPGVRGVLYCPKGFTLRFEKGLSKVNLSIGIVNRGKYSITNLSANSKSKSKRFIICARDLC